MGRPTVSGAPSSNKRDVVRAAAVRCFARRGLGGTTTREIARAAGLTEGTLYHYFPSKDALIDAAFRWSAFQAADVQRTMQRRATPLRERLLAVGADFLAALRRRPEWTCVVIREAMRGSPDARSSMRAVLVQLATERTRALTIALRDEIAAGRIARHDPRQMADLIFRALIGHFVTETIARSQSPRAAAADPFVVHLIDTIVMTLEPRRPPKKTDVARRRPRRAS